MRTRIDAMFEIRRPDPRDDRHGKATWKGFCSNISSAASLGERIDRTPDQITIHQTAPGCKPSWTEYYFDGDAPTREEAEEMVLTTPSAWPSYSNSLNSTIRTLQRMKWYEYQEEKGSYLVPSTLVEREEDVVLNKNSNEEEE